MEVPGLEFQHMNLWGTIQPILKWDLTGLFQREQLRTWQCPEPFSAAWQSLIRREVRGGAERDPEQEDLCEGQPPANQAHLPVLLCEPEVNCCFQATGSLGPSAAPLCILGWALQHALPTAWQLEAGNCMSPMPWPAGLREGPARPGHTCRVRGERGPGGRSGFPAAPQYWILPPLPLFPLQTIQQRLT